ncbi:MAG: hypothetical protein ACRDJW_14190 [Thermomicrobiales bacterium]
MESVIVGVIIGLWLLLFIPMTVGPLLRERRVVDRPPRVIRLDNHRRGPQRAA